MTAEESDPEVEVTVVEGLLGLGRIINSRTMLSERAVTDSWLRGP